MTVPTSLFVVRRNGKAHVTGNSILATLSALCEFCINPKLIASGQTQTKHLASRFDEATPAYSTFRGAGGRAGRRRARLWYDSCSPADPQQVNSDITTDLAGNAITPDEIRALRGRKPYPRYGDAPWVQGPGGVMPYPIHEASLEELAAQIEPMATLGQEAESVQGQSEPGAMPSPSTNGQGPVNRLPSEETVPPETNFAEDAEIEEPNGKPTKYWANGRSTDKALTW